MWRFAFLVLPACVVLVDPTLPEPRSFTFTLEGTPVLLGGVVAGGEVEVYTCGDQADGHWYRGSLVEGRAALASDSGGLHVEYIDSATPSVSFIDAAGAVHRGTMLTVEDDVGVFAEDTAFGWTGVVAARGDVRGMYFRSKDLRAQVTPVRVAAPSGFLRVQLGAEERLVPRLRSLRPKK
jgi:hypothetical protein